MKSTTKQLPDIQPRYSASANARWCPPGAAACRRERAAGMYQVLPFALAQQLVEIPYLIVQALTYSAIVYW